MDSCTKIAAEKTFPEGISANYADFTKKILNTGSLYGHACYNLTSKLVAALQVSEKKCGAEPPGFLTPIYSRRGDRCPLYMKTKEFCWKNLYPDSLTAKI